MTPRTDDPTIHEVEATPETVQWGYFDNSAEPVCRIESGDIVKIETITHQAGDAPDYLMDDKTREIYETIEMDERGPGVHIVTGPVHVEGAEPGDVLECRVLDLKPRLPYGVNLSANWGLLYDDFDRDEYVTIYEIDEDTATARAVFQYKFPGTYDDIGPMIDPDSVDRYPVLEDIRVPLRYHFGTAGVAPAEDGKIDTVPPSTYGGNMDDRRFVVGTSMYYPVHVDGALFTAGDSHFTQGDGEISGTAIEASLDGVVQLFLRDDIELSRNPVLETPKYWVARGHDEDLDEAIRVAALEMIDFLENNKGLSRAAAYSLLSLHGDFQVSQVVNGVKGMRCLLPKDLFPIGGEER